MNKQLALLAGMGMALGGCLYQPVQPHGEALRAQSGAVAPDLAGFSGQTDLNTASNIHPLIRAYFQDYFQGQLEFCDGSVQYSDPTDYCYGTFDDAFIKARLPYHDNDVALVTTENMKGYEGSGGYGGEVILLRGNTAQVLDGGGGFDFKLKRKGNRLTFSYKAREMGETVPRKRVIKL